MLANTFVYDALSFSFGGLDRKPFLNITYSSILELSAIMVSHVVYSRFGRNLPYTLNVFLGGAAFVCVPSVTASEFDQLLK